jgi:hypothetical protein
VVNGKVYDVLDDKALFEAVVARTARLQFDRQNRSAAVGALLKGVLTSPLLTLRGAIWLGRKLWPARVDLLLVRRVDKLSITKCQELFEIYLGALLIAVDVLSKDDFSDIFA